MISDYFKKLNNAYGITNKKEIQLYSIKGALLKDFDNNPYSFHVQVDGKERTVIITNSSKENSKTIISKPDETFGNGDIVKWIDTFWIIVNADPNNEIYSKGLLLKCVSSLKWLDEIGEICEIPFAITNDNIGNFGINTDRIIELPNERRNIVIPSNAITDKIHKKQRFIIDGRAWEVTAINRLDEGLNYITLQEDLIDLSRDNTELRIADYIDKVADYSVKIRSYDVTALHIGQTLRLEVDFLNKGNPMDSRYLTYQVSDEAIAKIDSDGIIHPVSTGSVTISVRYKDAFDSIQLNIIESVVNNYNVKIIGDNSIKYNMTKSYQCSFTNNGTPIIEKSNFWLTSIDGKSPTDLAMITEQSSDLNTCKIKAGNIKGTVLLHVENISKLAKATHHIEIKSLL